LVVLEVKKLTKEFPGVIALKDVDFQLMKGEIHAVVGENGAGKSTLVKIISGVYPPTSGKIFINGKEMHFKSTREAFKYVGVVYQERELVPYFTGLQNLFLGYEIKMGFFLKERDMRFKAEQVMKKYGLSVDLDRLVSEMGSAEKTILTILKILFRNPAIMIFDEPTSSLSIKEARILLDLIKNLKKKGVSILYISHNIQEVLSIADRITVLRNGENVATLEREYATEQKIIKCMINKELREQYPKIPRKIGDELFRVENYSNDIYDFKNISFYIRKGEIVGFAGLVGSGRTELAKSIYTAVHPYRGKIFLDGKKLALRRTSDPIKNGIVMIPENRREEGLFLDFSVEKNLTLPHIHSLKKLFLISNTLSRFKALRVIKALNIKASNVYQQVKTLSGGNQQKVVIGKWLEKYAKLWIFDETTQGVDVESKTEIYIIMQRLANDGCGIWFISSDIRELTAIADRIYVMRNKEIVAEFSPPYDYEEILLKMLGGGKN